MSYNTPTPAYTDAQSGYDKHTHEQSAYSTTTSPPPAAHIPAGGYQPAMVNPGQPQSFQTAVPLNQLSRSPAPVDCPNCKQRALTTVHYESGDNTHLWALVFCCLLCAPCIPYIMKSFKDVKHSCGSCGVDLALWHKSGGVDVLLHA